MQLVLYINRNFVTYLLDLKPHYSLLLKNEKKLIHTYIQYLKQYDVIQHFLPLSQTTLSSQPFAAENQKIK